MSIKPENVTTSEECVHETNTYVHRWCWLSPENIADLPIDWKQLTDDEFMALSQLIMVIETMIYEKNNPTH